MTGRKFADLPPDDQQRLLQLAADLREHANRYAYSESVGVPGSLPFNMRDLAAHLRAAYEKGWDVDGYLDAFQFVSHRDAWTLLSLQHDEVPE